MSKDSKRGTRARDPETVSPRRCQRTRNEGLARERRTWSWPTGATFREAAARWGRGDFSAPFPPFSFPPRVVPERVARVL
ncbi:hypothetical protein F0U63_44890 [Cystobacter fuscus]|nr:hypothetical protein F0U63_44890 [Cystobacter fuscus]